MTTPSKKVLKCGSAQSLTQRNAQGPPMNRETKSIDGDKKALRQNGPMVANGYQYRVRELIPNMDGSEGTGPMHFGRHKLYNITNEMVFSPVSNKNKLTYLSCSQLCCDQREESDHQDSR
jgi:hypothetical protein